MALGCGRWGLVEVLGISEGASCSHEELASESMRSFLWCGEMVWPGFESFQDFANLKMFGLLGSSVVGAFGILVQ